MDCVDGVEVVSFAYRYRLSLGSLGNFDEAERVPALKEKPPRHDTTNKKPCF